jgi:cysteinyl-tRNA synthetase
MAHDLHAPRALATMWSMLKDESLTPSQTLACLLEMDKILGLNLDSVSAQLQSQASEPVPDDILAMVAERTLAKKQKNYARADELRAIVEQEGWHLKDTPDGTTVTRNL